MGLMDTYKSIKELTLNFEKEPKDLKILIKTGNKYINQIKKLEDDTEWKKKSQKLAKYLKDLRLDRNTNYFGLANLLHDLKVIAKLDSEVSTDCILASRYNVVGYSGQISKIKLKGKLSIRNYYASIMASSLSQDPVNFIIRAIYEVHFKMINDAIVSMFQFIQYIWVHKTYEYIQLIYQFQERLEPIISELPQLSDSLKIITSDKEEVYKLFFSIFIFKNINQTEIIERVTSRMNMQVKYRTD